MLVVLRRQKDPSYRRRGVERKMSRHARDEEKEEEEDEASGVRVGSR